MTENKPLAWRGKTRGGSGGYLFFIWLIRFLGVKAAYIFLGFVIVYFIPFAPKATRAVWRYSRQIMSYGWWQSVGMLFRNYYLLGQTLIDKVAIGNGKIGQYHFEFDGREELLKLLNKPGGVVMVGAHMGNWEIGVPFFDGYGQRMNIVMYDAEYQKIKEMMDKNTASHNYKIISVNRDRITHVFEIEDALRKQEYVCFQGDRFISDSHTLRCCFLGKEACFPAGPFQIAARMGETVVFYFAMREKGMRYRFYFRIAVQEEGKKPREREHNILKQYVSVLEQIVRKYPAQWFNYYDFWIGGC